MADLTPTNGFVGFPDYIVPPSPIRIEKMYEEVKVIDDRIAANYAKLHRIEKEEKETLRPVGFQPYGGADAPKTTMHGKAYNEVSKKINQQLERKRAIYSENEQWRWAKQYIDAGISYSQTCVNPFFTQMYQYASARVNENEFGHITNLYAGEFGKQLPAYIRQVNQIPAIINRLVGEADSMGLKFSVGVSNSDAINNKLEEYAEEMAEKMTRKARQVGGVDKLLS